MTLDVLDGGTDRKQLLFQLALGCQHVQLRVGYHGSLSLWRVVPLDSGVAQQLLYRVQVVVVREHLNHVLSGVSRATKDAVRAELFACRQAGINVRRPRAGERLAALFVAL